MSQQVVIAGALFNDVPSISVPDSNNVWHPFLDTTIAANAAAASDIAQGKLAYVNGSLVTGTASGGGSSFTLLAEQDVAVSTTSTSATNVDSISIAGIANKRNSGDKIIFISIFDKAGAQAGRCYGSLSYSCRVSAVVGTTYYVKSNGTMDYSSNSYGVYAGISTNAVTIYARCSSSNYPTIQGTFNVRVYELDFPSGLSPFA